MHDRSRRPDAERRDSPALAHAQPGDRAHARRRDDEPHRHRRRGGGAARTRRVRRRNRLCAVRAPRLSVGPGGRAHGQPAAAEYHRACAGASRPDGVGRRCARVLRTVAPHRKPHRGLPGREAARAPGARGARGSHPTGGCAPSMCRRVAAGPPRPARRGEPRHSALRRRRRRPARDRRHAHAGADAPRDGHARAHPARRPAPALVEHRPVAHAGGIGYRRARSCRGSARSTRRITPGMPPRTSALSTIGPRCCSCPDSE